MEIIFDGYGEARALRVFLLSRLPALLDVANLDTTDAGLATPPTSRSAGGVQTIHTTADHCQAAARGRRAQRVGGRLAPVELHRQQPLLRPGSQAQRMGGLQAGHRLPGYQRSLSSGNTPVYPPGESHDVTVAHY